ncbi:MAG: radical SAM protein [Candidatus Magasanikbacteria bacterium]|nr:radical SAM protein [Candidatus Magasanikbacteria bacterium]
MKILLVDPPCQRFMGFYRFYFPLGLSYLAATLQRSGHEVIIYDAEHDTSCISPSMKETSSRHQHYLNALTNDTHPVWEEFSKILADFKPNIVGISALTVKLASAIKLASITKSYNQKIIVVLGGEHVTVRPKDALHKNVDYIISGEGELALLKLVRELENKESPRKVISGHLISELDILPIPALKCLQNEKSYRPIDMGLMVTARGCPHSCSFCSLSSIWGKKVRFHSITRTITEIKMRMERYGTKYFSFRNGTFTQNRNRTIDFCHRLIEERLDIKWECLTRVDTVDSELLDLMQKAGCSTIRIGVESGSNDSLKYMNKGINKE